MGVFADALLILLSKALTRLQIPRCVLAIIFLRFYWVYEPAGAMYELTDQGQSYLAFLRKRSYSLLCGHMTLLCSDKYQ